MNRSIGGGAAEATNQGEGGVASRALRSSLVLPTRSLQELNKIPRFVPRIREGLVCKVYDADTITVVAALDIAGAAHEQYRFSVRLAGIDAPEMRTRDATEKRVATEARDALRDRILGKSVRLDVVKTDKYGRLLANVFAGELSLNDWLLEQHFAVPYDGGKKVVPADWGVFRAEVAISTSTAV